jgi:hypothetical protein
MDVSKSEEYLKMKKEFEIEYAILLINIQYIQIVGNKATIISLNKLTNLNKAKYVVYNDKYYTFTKIWLNDSKHRIYNSLEHFMKEHPNIVITNISKKKSFRLF